MNALYQLCDFIDDRNQSLKHNFIVTLSGDEWLYLVELLKEQVAEHGDGTAQTILAQLLNDKKAKDQGEKV